MNDFSLGKNFSLNRQIDYYELILSVARPDIGKEGLKNVYVQYDTYETRSILVDFEGSGGVVASGRRELYDISYLDVSEQTKILSFFVDDIFKAYIQERIRLGYSPLENFRSKKGAFE